MKIPAFVDMHVHFRDFNQSDKATIQSETQAAIKGGYCAVCCMPNTNPVIDNLDAVKKFKEKTQQFSPYIYPIAAITKGLTSNEITDFKLFKENGVIGFSNDGKPIEDMGLMREIISRAKESEALIISHAEDTQYEPENKKSEYKAIERELEAVKNTNGRLHFAHISTLESVELISDAKKDGLNITCETAPHYFSLTKNDRTPDGRYKMNPPLRDVKDVKKIIEGLQEGIIDVIATDHAPHRVDEKLKQYSVSPYGIVGLETAFAVGYTYLVDRGLLTLEQLSEKMSANPAKILGIDISGKFIEFTPTEWRISEEKLLSKCKITPYNNMLLKGAIND